MTKTDEALPPFDPSAFVGALLLAPFVVAALFFWAMFIPVFAVFFGGLPYLVFGTPVLLWIATHTRVTFWGCAFGGLLAQALFVTCYGAFLLANPMLDDGILPFLALWGIPFSAAWCGTFALLYQGFHPETASRERRSAPEPDIIA